MSTSSPILIVGSMAFDDLDLPSGKARDVVGGSATYAAMTASVFAPVRVVAVVGDDFPEHVLIAMQARGIDTRGIERATGKTFRWAGRYDQDLVHRTTLDTQLNVFADFRPRLPDAFRDTPFLLLGNIHPGLQLDVLEQVRSPRLVVADTMNFWITGEPTLLASMLKRIDVLIVNDEEARQLSGIHNIRRAARDILARGPKRLVIKRGEHGALLFDEEGVFAAHGFPLEDEVDPTGAGDSFAGGFLGYLATQPEVTPLALRRAMVHATATASFCVEAVGTGKVGVLVRDEVSARVTEIQKLYEFGASTM
ncbi:PfkB family carbohydrate kinase [Polyangium sorediatum]|uniref:PfkB family carbohydrate kinase n=1 Tax=Polyangium sorediatum TaxID=889274 RepID=A0ABT6P7R0_9BACT|nr:PfkB family carbohydrate kinase [Polyangium sorediatum]MDI1436642.1 PfkB family carbohydrate kinase [Polyangium sorediatum]